MEKRKRIIKNSIILLSVVAAANIVSFWLFGLLGDKNQFIISVYILAVSIIARWTDGYLYGVLASLICVISVNFFFHIWPLILYFRDIPSPLYACY